MAVGFFCVEGTIFPEPCLPGMYCEREALSYPTGPCRASYYCPAGASQENPTNNVTGNICPRGYYCPEGTSQPYECVAGTYSNAEGLVSLSDCNLCSAGYYCGSSGLTAPTAMCNEGYYCLPGQSVPTPVNITCMPGHFCVMGTPDQVRCPSGTYQDEVGANSYKTCLSGYYCDSTVVPVSSLEMFFCPRGYVCPEGTRFAEEYPCPAGSYANRTNLVDLSQCLPCLPGFVCSVP